ncbi:hypothetical protein F3Y22_tig00111402pilonHSYRG00940 [Hibiscus syriacus]|uniref:Uncharacterized protein n=1 Tax=Hibiscus syriacus TaxID=106335 RepID=A0A6A2Y508_HIBSY|nr:hypothetical protein F3Y22_tig00111402pilonHSYRG00940 [Hibiscus syriacus]
MPQPSLARSTVAEIPTSGNQKGGRRTFKPKTLLTLFTKLSFEVWACKQIGWPIFVSCIGRLQANLCLICPNRGSLTQLRLSYSTRGVGKRSVVQSNQVSVQNNSSNNVNGIVDLDSSVFLKRANELREEGDLKYQNKDYVAALQLYDNALKLIPKTHPDRAVFHSNRAACLMQMKPVDYDAVIAECNMAIQVQPHFVQPILRRARAFEAVVGKYEMAMEDAQSLLGAEPNNKSATAVGPSFAQPVKLAASLTAAVIGAVKNPSIKQRKVICSKEERRVGRGLISQAIAAGCGGRGPFFSLHGGDRGGEGEL